jgi:hypothetical protein
VDAPIQDVQDRDIVVTVYNITGSIRNSLDVYFLQRLKERLIDHWTTFLKSGTRKRVSNRLKEFLRFPMFLIFLYLRDSIFACLSVTFLDSNGCKR